MITIPSLDSTQDIADTDLILVTTSEGLSYKMAGSEVNKRLKVIIANSTTVTGAPLKTGNVVRIHFTADLTAQNNTTALTLNYNGVNYNVKIPKNGALADYVAFKRSSTYKYLQAYTTLELLYDGTNFVLIGNPVVWSGSGFTIFANATINKADVGLSSVANTGDSATPVSGGTTKFTTGGAYTELAKKVDNSSVGAASGVASLDSAGKVPSNQLPSYVDDVLEYSAKSSFPATGEAGKIYVDKATGKCWRWSGSAYVELSSYAVATQSASGLMSSTDKAKLDGITTGSAAGNVPLVGTALGTTNNNIVVTDTNGKLKPSGTTLGSAAGKTAGSAADNVPLIGTALGTTNNNIVVTDANGKLKPSGTTLKSAAGKTAGSAAGNVPLVGTALGTTDNNVAVTDTNGKLKPYGKTAAQLMSYGVFVNTSGTISSNVATFTIETPTGLTLEAGTILRCTFQYALESSAAINEVRLTYGGVTKAIMATQGRTETGTGAVSNPVKLSSHYFNGGLYNSSKRYKVWDAYTTLELMYTGEWLVMGDTVLCSYRATSTGYIVKANGFIEQWGINTASSGNTQSITLNVDFNSATSYSTTATVQRNNADGEIAVIKEQTSSAFVSVQSASGRTIYWRSIGY